MQDNPKGADASPAFSRNSDEDARDQSQVLREVISISPEIATMDELVRELTFSSGEFVDRERIERAVRDLTGNGLLHVRAGDLVLPTRAAVHFHVLFDA